MWRRFLINLWQFALARRMLGSFSLVDDEVIVVLFRLSDFVVVPGWTDVGPVTRQVATGAARLGRASANEVDGFRFEEREIAGIPRDDFAMSNASSHSQRQL